MRRHLTLVVTALASVALAASTMAPSTAADHTGVVSASPGFFTPDVLDATGYVRQATQIGDTVVVVGLFTQVRERPTGQVLTRNNVFAYSARTGIVSTTFMPAVDGEVWAAVPTADGAAVWLAGGFTKVNAGIRTARIAKVSVANGALVPGFRPPVVNGRISTLDHRAGTLFIGGNFTRVGGVTRELLTALDATTGAERPGFALDFAEIWNKGKLDVRSVAFGSGGSRMVVVGNFRTVNGLARPQAVMLDINASGQASVATWATTKFGLTCSSRPDTYMRDVAASPDGQYFVVVTTGAFGGGANAGTMCDAASRWEFDRSGPGQLPTWVDYTGGDTLTQVAITSDTVYVGGHQRWMNNPYAADKVGPGAVVREGLAALDPRNGLPFTWNPGRDRGYGVYGLDTTEQGLYVGHDTTWIGGKARERLAYFPRDGGTTLPPEEVGTLPGVAYLLGTGGSNTVVRRGFDGVTATAPTTVDGAGASWSTARGGFVVDGVLWAFWSNGTFTKQSIGAGALGARTSVPLNGVGLTTELTSTASMTSVFYDRVQGRIYYTLAGSNTLYYRYFTPESGIVGGVRFTAATGSGDLSYSTFKGAFLVGSTLYAGSTDTSLSSWQWNGSVPVAGTRRVVGSGVDWRAQALVLTALP